MVEARDHLRPLAPGAMIGMLGGGQLGRMSLLAGRRLGFRFGVLDPAGDRAPAAPVADRVWGAAYDDFAALDAMAAHCERVTLEFENIPGAAAQHVEAHLPICPGPEVLRICQHRRREKEFLRDQGFPCAPFRVVHSVAELREAVRAVGLPAVLKSAAFGYDGKGQVKLRAETDLAAAWAELGYDEAVVEHWIEFEGEFSVVCARNASGEEAVYPVFENIHRDHILDTTIWPARLSPARAAEAAELGRAICRALRVEGVLTVELFLTASGWLVNEMAPRPHNSGHVTLDAGLTSQFEQHIRAVANWSLGDPGVLRPGAMFNLLGDRWKADGSAPDWSTVWRHPQAKLHLYGKHQAPLGRKMGHVTVLAATPDEALREARALDAALPRRGPAA